MLAEIGDVRSPYPCAAGFRSMDNSNSLEIVGVSSTRSAHHLELVGMPSTRTGHDSEVVGMPSARSVPSTGTVITSRTTLRTSYVSADILRGVRVDKILQGFGRAWIGPSAGNEDFFVHSERVDQLDDFISHDWKSGRWAKFFTLCYLYNGRAAYTASIVVATMVCILQSDMVALLPRLHVAAYTADIVGTEHKIIPGIWCCVVQPAVFVVFLIHWQHIKCEICRRATFLRMLLPCQRVFVDKFCIHQTDSEKKTQGILAIGSFLSSSSRLVILWSPRYFTRLWCAYELAVWTHLEKSWQSAYFRPLSQIRMYIATYVALYMTGMIFIFALSINSDVADYCLPFIFLSVYVFQIRAIRIELGKKQILRTQLHNFSIRHTACFCCSHDHIDPVSLKSIPCDRQLVYDTLAHWFPADSMENSLAKFDEHVQGHFAASVQRYADTAYFTLLDLLCASSPVLMWTFDNIAGCGHLSWYFFLRYILGEYIMGCFVFVPINGKVHVLLAKLFNELFGVPGCRTIDHVTTFACACVATIFTTVIAVAVVIPTQWQALHGVILIDLALVGLLIFLFKRF